MVTQRLRKYIVPILPLQCEICHLNSKFDHLQVGICCHCQQYFLPKARCQCCGLAMSCDAEQCGHCLNSPPSWQRLYCVGDYHRPISTFVHRLKFHGEFWQAKKLAHMLAPLIESPARQLTYVPLHWQRYMIRGYNQSELLAKSLGQILDIPCFPFFRRVRKTLPQLGLNSNQRKANLNQAFILRQARLSNHVAIVDDVLTTGSTVDGLCHLLRNAGVEKVDIYCICRTANVG